MMKNIPSTIILVVVLSTLVYALDLSMDVKDYFDEGETLSFNYTITSNKTEDVTYMTHIYCPNAPNPILEKKILRLKAMEPFRGVYQSITVNEQIEPQVCTASLRLSGFQEFLEKKFRIDTQPSFWFEPKTCIDASCSYRQGIFALGEEIFMDYESEVDDPAISSLLRYSDGEETRIDLPFSIMAEQIGTYALEINASREGYKTMRQILPFVVIKEHAKIRAASICNADGVCSGRENYQNCPQDCSKPTEMLATTSTVRVTTTVAPTTTLPSEKPKNNGGYLIYLIALFIILPTAFLIYRKTKTGEIKKEKKELEVTEWVKKNLRDGEDPEALKEILREGGYDPKIVDELTKKLYG